MLPPALVQCFRGHCRRCARQPRDWRRQVWIFSAQAEKGDVLPSCFISHTVSKYPFHGVCSATFFALLYFVCDFMFKLVADMLSSVPKCKKAV